jgi:hypothetical protein
LGRTDSKPTRFTSPDVLIAFHERGLVISHCQATRDPQLQFSGVIGCFLNYFLEIAKIVKSLTMPKLFKTAHSQE